jgi:hypothetical protein
LICNNCLKYKIVTKEDIRTLFKAGVQFHFSVPTLQNFSMFLLSFLGSEMLCL